MSRGPSLADLTTLRIGGPIGVLVETSTEEDFVEAIRSADALGDPLLILGGGSNVVASDLGFPGVVLRDRRTEVAVEQVAPGGDVRVTVAAGVPWDDVVAQAVVEGWAGLEALSGIPGSTGATPVQNVGAYGHEVSEVIEAVRVWDRAEGEVRELTRDGCSFSYRDSLLKRSMRDGDGRRWRPTPRFVVLDVTLGLEAGNPFAPIRYVQLADALGVDLGQQVPLERVREAVLALRRSKGMVLDSGDHDTWSVGSFFMNPIVTAEQAARLPKETPRYPLDDSDPTSLVKTSAAWLIEHAGFGKGFALTEGAPASLSTKHTLALTNRGGATSDDIVALARRIRDGVWEDFGVVLEPEPVLVGLEL